MDLGIEGRTAAVPGASQGLGFETAKALAEEGVRVAIAGRDRGRVEAAAGQIGDLATPLVADVSDAVGARSFLSQAREALGEIDILLANTGGPPPGAAVDLDFDTMQGAIDQSMFSMMALCADVLPSMRSRGWGRILGVTSIGVREPLAGMVYSNTARAGLTAYYKTLATEVASDGVTVNTLQPGFHETERLRTLMGGNLESMSQQVPARRIGSAEDFGRVAAFLCSEWANYLTGVNVPISGGSQAAA